ncbi:MAG: ABC transporter permease [Lachnospiraceae bacterium]|nr:ABC transporter permease [Lachnospiraceae bacterium]
MASYNLNEILKQKAGKTEKTGSVGLDDVSRVKVLSPGRQVFKRFMRNRLAVFGSGLLILMFVFSFLGPLFYPYGQKEIFYKYDTQNVNYALAKEITSYTGYKLSSDITVPRTVTTSINSMAKKLIAADGDGALLVADDDAFLLNRINDDVFNLSSVTTRKVASVGSGSALVGTYDMIDDTITFNGQKIDGLLEALKADFNRAGGEFTFEGVTYAYEKDVAKSYNIYSEMNGVVMYDTDLPASFEGAFEKAAGSKAYSFVVSGKTYFLVESTNGYDAYFVSGEKAAMVFTRLTFNAISSDVKISDELKANTLTHIMDGTSFKVDGNSYVVAESEGLMILKDEKGGEIAELSQFSVRRYTGEDSIEYDLKKEIEELVLTMAETGAKSETLLYNIPLQDESGLYTYDEEGNLQYSEAELVITRRDTGEYVINCDQIIYLIDMFSPASKEHILGTDGDGFDVLARVMYGGRISLMVGFVVVFLEIILGVIMGGLAGYYGGWVDNLIMRMVDIFYCLPSLPIMIILGAMMDSLRMDTYIRLMIMMATLGILGWAGVARMVRGQILSLREQEFMVAAEATGIRVKDRIFRHLIPNVMPQLIVIATMGMGSVILTESTLSFLGLGVKHPLATWGTIINSVSSATAMAHYQHIWIPVGLLICLTVIAFNFVGDGLRDAYDPKSKR